MHIKFMTQTILLLLAMIFSLDLQASEPEFEANMVSELRKRVSFSVVNEVVILAGSPGRSIGSTSSRCKKLVVWNFAATKVYGSIAERVSSQHPEYCVLEIRKDTVSEVMEGLLSKVYYQLPYSNRILYEIWDKSLIPRGNGDGSKGILVNQRLIGSATALTVVTSKNEESDGESGGKKGVVSEEPMQTVPEGEPETSPEPRILAGEIGSSSRWGSGWLDLATVTDFAAGDVLQLRIGGTASKVLVRLLSEGKFPDSSDGIVGGAIIVPENRIVEVVLKEDRKGIIQISVHGGPNPWGRFPLGGGNGLATLEVARLVH